VMSGGAAVAVEALSIAARRRGLEVAYAVRVAGSGLPMTSDGLSAAAINAGGSARSMGRTNCRDTWVRYLPDRSRRSCLSAMYSVENKRGI